MDGPGKGNPAYGKAFALAIRIVKLCRRMNAGKSDFVLTRQLLRSGTSIGANLAEANGAISKADFSAKVSIAYKETQETKYWLNLLKATGDISEDVHASHLAEADEVARILFSVLKTTRIRGRKPTTNE